MKSFRILTPYETELADALFEAMFPSDGESPDVRDAGVTEYLDRSKATAARTSRGTSGCSAPWTATPRTSTVGTSPR